MRSPFMHVRVYQIQDKLLPLLNLQKWEIMRILLFSSVDLLQLMHLQLLGKLTNKTELKSALAFKMIHSCFWQFDDKHI